jgi:hypothetical protein
MALYTQEQLDEALARYGEDYEDTITYALSFLAHLLVAGDMIRGIDYGYRVRSRKLDRWERSDGQPIIATLLGIIRDFAGLDYELFRIYAPLDWYEMYMIPRSRAPKDQAEYAQRGSIGSSP